MNLATTAVLILSATARAASFVSVDGRFTIQCTDQWNRNSWEAGGGSRKAPAITLTPLVGNNYLAALMITDVELAEGYAPGRSPAEIAKADLEKRQAKNAQGRYTAVQPVHLGEGLEAYGYGQQNGDRFAANYYFSLAGKGYYAICIGAAWEKECLAALQTLKPLAPGAKAPAERGPMLAPKAFPGIRLMVPPGWIVRDDTPKLFVMMGGPKGDPQTFQLRPPLLELLMPSTDAARAKMLESGIKQGCPSPVRPVAPVASVQAGAGSKAKLWFSTCEDAHGGPMLGGVVELGKKHLMLVTTGDAARIRGAVELLSSLEAAP